jgi:hypothetical protein
MKHRLMMQLHPGGVLYMRGDQRCRVSAEDTEEDCQKLYEWLVELGLENPMEVTCGECGARYDARGDCGCHDGEEQCSVCCAWFPEEEVKGYWCEACKAEEKARK